MTSLNYLDTLESFSRQPIFLVRLTVTGTIAGSQVFRFSNKESQLIHLQIGQDVRPYLLNFRGRQTRIRPDQSVTERSRMGITFADDPDAPDFDPAVFNITTGGSFWKRLFVAQPDFIGSKVEVLRGFVEPGFAESDFELIFVGRLEDNEFRNDGTVTLIAKDALILTNKEAPAEISDNNQIAADFNPFAFLIIVDNASEITVPSTFGSRDEMPLVIRVEPGIGGQEEDIIVGDISGNTITVGENQLGRSEDFANGDWDKTAGITVTSNVKVSPFGVAFLGDKIEFASIGDQIKQQISTSVLGLTTTFSVFLRSSTPGSITLTVEDRLGVPIDTFSLQVNIIDIWQRFDITSTFSGAANTNPFIGIKREAGDLAEIFAYGTQFEKRSFRSFYVATTDSASTGGDAGRASFDTSKKTHKAGDAFKEVVVYRHQLSEDGVSPVIIIRDLASRVGFTDEDVDLEIVGAEFEADSGASFRRGRVSGLPDTTLIESQSINTLIREVREQSGVDVWISETGKLRIKSPLTIIPGESIKVVSDELNVVTDSHSVKANTDSRVTRFIIYFNLKLDADGDSPSDFLNVRVNVNVAIEALSGPKSRSVFSKWIHRSAEAEKIANLTVSRFQRGAKTSRLSFELKDDIEVDVGNIIALNSEALLIPGGSGSSAIRGITLWQVTQKRDRRERGQVSIEMVIISDKPVCFITEAIPPTGTFPEDYDDATEEQKVIFGFIGSAGTNLLGDDQDEGCVIL